MKILLLAVNAKYIHSNLAVYSLQAYAKEHGESVDLAEYTINQPKDVILRGVFKEHPDVIAISCYIWNRSFIRELIRDLHKILPETEIWTGGPEVSFDARAFLTECPQVRVVMKGEGEGTFLELVRAVRHADSDSDYKDIAGISYRDKAGHIVDNPLRDVMNLSEIPFVYRDLSIFKNRIIYYESSRGCPFSCSYCLSSVDKRLRFRSLDLVFRELQFFLDQRVPQVKFVDRTFNCDAKRAAAIWQYLIDHDNGFTNFHFEVAADILTQEEIDLIAKMRPGMIQLEIGVQSTNEKTIEAIRRRMDFHKVEDHVLQIQQLYKVHQHLDLIAGLPYEDYESFGRSFNDVYALRPQQLQLGFLKVLKGSFMYDHVEEYGCLYQDKEPYEVLSTRWLPYEDVLRLKLVEEMVEVYYNSGQFLMTLPLLETLFSTPFALYEALGTYYEEKGYLEIAHTRIRRCEILLEFAEFFCKEQVPRLKELLLCDLYLRENMKTRPAWAPDQTPYKRSMKQFYALEAQDHAFLPQLAAYDERQLARMTHIEIFSCDPKNGENKETACLFSYADRDPLTGNGEMREILLPDQDGDEERRKQVRK